MRVIIIREKSTEEETLGRLYFGHEFQCYTLEDEFRTQKKYGETRIPAGTYEIQIRENSSKFASYNTRFKDHPGMLWLKEIENFRYVYIHIGNTDRDTAGCPLVGEGYVERVDAKRRRIALTNSRKAYEKIYYPIKASICRGLTYLTIIDQDKEKI